MDLSAYQDYPTNRAGNEAADFLAGDGEMQARMRGFPWRETSLGACEYWPQSLKTAVRILLTSRFAMWLCWGNDLTFFYNNAYRPTLGVKHAWALGASVRDVWREIWPDIGPRIDHVLTSGEATWDEGLMLLLERSGYPEETYHTFSYSPLADDSGEVVGVLCVVAEDTERVISRRRMANFRGLAADLARSRTRANVLRAAERQLAANPRDLPFCFIYLFQPDGMARLVCATGANWGDPIAPACIDPADSGSAWPAGRILAERLPIALDDIRARFQDLPMGAWRQPPSDAVLLPIEHQGHGTLAGFLVAGLNPHLKLDESYSGFLDLATGQIRTCLARAAAYENESNRAEALAVAVETLRTRTMELEAVLETVPAAVWFTSDPDAKSISGNRQSETVLRLPRGARLSLSALQGDNPPFRVFRDGMQASVASLPIKRAARGEEVRDDEIEIRFADGGATTLLTNGMPLRDAAGQIRGAVVAGIDVSGRKRQEARFREVVESAPSAMVMIDPAGRIVMVNTQASQLLGYSGQELLGQSLETLVPERFRADHPRLRKSFGASPRTRRMGAEHDLYGLRKDGSEFPVEIGLNPIDTDNGSMVLAAIIDISDRKQKEDSIQAALNEKDVLLGEIHHRVKNNLQIIYSLLGLQSTRLSDPVVLDMLRDSQNRIRSMALIHQTLYQSKDFAEVDFGQFLDTLVPTLIASYGFNPNNVAFSVTSERVLLPIDAAIPCGLVVNELISNALRHAFPSGRGGRIDVTLGHEPDGYVALCVRDDGIGVPDHIDPTETETLGLQLVSLLADQLGGSVVMHRFDPTSFLLRFPVKKAANGHK